MQRFVLLPFGALVCLLLASCGGSDGSSPTPSLDGTAWRLTAVGSADALPGGMLGFSGGKLTGSTGCNSFGGTYSQDGSSLTVTLGPSTMIGCPPPLDAQERAVLKALPATASFAQDGDALELLDSSGTTLLAYSHLSPAALVGPKWQVTGVNTGNAVSTPIPGTTLTVTFDADGRATGSAGCNTFTASYTLEGATLAVSPPASTRKLCGSPDGVMGQETAFLRALEASTTVEAEASGMTLRDASGATQLTLAE